MVRRARKARRFELDVDLRTTDVWREVSPLVRTGRLTLGVFAAAVRTAYGLGYRDALGEDGALFDAHYDTTHGRVCEQSVKTKGDR